MEIHNEFIAREYPIVFYTGKAVLNKVHRFVDINGNNWVFPSSISFTFKIWEEREGGLLIIDWDATNLSLTGNDLILNAPAADTNIIKGKYYYEIEYITPGGYSVLVAYGEAKFI